MVKWIVIIVGALIVLAGAAWFAGSRQPVGHTASVVIDLSFPPESVWAVITDFAATPSWFDGVKSSERIADIGGNPAWREDFGGFKVDMETRASQPPRHLERVVHSTSAGFRGSWTWDLEPTASGTKLTITERGEVDNPFFRLMMSFGDPSATARQYGAALERRLAR